MGRTQLGEHVWTHPRLAMGVGGLKEKKLGNRQCQEWVAKEFPVSPSRTGRQVMKRGLAGEEYGISEPSELV